MEKKCGNCGNYNAFYTKAYCKFYREKLGYCHKVKKVMPRAEICDCWRGISGMRRRIDKPMVLRALEAGLTDIAAIKQIFTEIDE